MTDGIRRASYSTGRWCLDVEQTFITVTTSHSEADPDWRFTDRAGHEHRHSGAPTDYYPTLRYVVDGQHWCDGISEGSDLHDPHLHVDASHYECQLCGEHIEPGRREPTPRSIPAQRSITLTGPLGDETVVCAPISRETGEGLEDLLRRLRMTTTPAIQDRLCEQWVEQHPQAIVERQTRIRLPAVPGPDEGQRWTLHERSPSNAAPM